MNKLVKKFKGLSKKSKIAIIAGLAAVPVVAVVVAVPVALLVNQGDGNEYDGGSLQAPADQNTSLAYARKWLAQTEVTLLPMDSFVKNKAEAVSDKEQISQTLGIDLQELPADIAVSVSKKSGSSVVAYEVTNGVQKDYVTKEVSRSQPDEKILQAFLFGLSSLQVTRLSEADMKAMSVTEKTNWDSSTGIVFPASAQPFAITYLKPYGASTFYLDVTYGKATGQASLSPATWNATDEQVNAQKDLVSLMLVNTVTVDERTFIYKSVAANTSLDQSGLGINVPAEVTDTSGITVQKEWTINTGWQTFRCYNVTYSVTRGSATVSGMGKISFFQEPATKDANYISKELLKRV